ncbi:MAG: hypothetical protein CM1200mP36_09880 [Gammaproteobacteria bacterium]|nr:MAG: hypothetical protein CM1200mP36_09880 [Gammaproteobacteria bacterium]
MTLAVSCRRHAAEGGTDAGVGDRNGAFLREVEKRAMNYRGSIRDADEALT